MKVSRGKHVLFIVENNPVPQDIRVWNEATYLQKVGYDVSIISPSDKITPHINTIDGIRIYYHPRPIEAAGKIGFIFEYFNALIWETIFSVFIFLNKPFQIIHSANPPDLVFIIAMIFKMFKVKYIFDHHDICPETYLAKYSNKDRFYHMLLFLEKSTFKIADVVISTNESYKKIAIERGMKNDNEIFVVRNGPSLSKINFPPPNYIWKNEFRYLVGYLGVIGSQEGIEQLLEIAYYIVYKKKVKDIKFIVVGKGPHLNKMLNLCENMHLNKYVQFTGYIPYEKLYEILATTDVCINPEFRNDFTDKSTMIKIMDYMTFGKPIIQFSTVEGRITAGDASIYIQDNDIIAFANELLKLLKNSIERKNMGEIGRKRIFKKLNWDLQVVNLKKAYDSLYLK